MTLNSRSDTQTDIRWEALRKRDKSAEGTFVYGVLTTGVYCRPSCPSRLPRIENVRFFAANEDAERAGFRPCMRCKPNSASLDERQIDAIANACALIEAAEERPDFGAIAQAVGMSRHHFHRVFKQITGLTPGTYLTSLRERRAIAGLGKGSSVTEAIYEAGYGSSSRFYEAFAPKLGLKPAAYSKGGVGEIIRFAVGECSLGSILVAATTKGICAIEFGDTLEGLLQSFQDRFANAELVGGDANFERIVAEVIACAEEPRRRLELPLHVRGTAFQHKIWRTLRDIAPGETMTYAEVAAKSGNPGAVRAAANACASNKLAVAIPCHRVVRTDGSLSGYRWGVERKAALIEREARISPA
jgi:AraC family transcriptional regulator, regulatory protein of adaptative response / methylated-DNA-[protein]-cysteine methyltransferase